MISKVFFISYTHKMMLTQFNKIQTIYNQLAFFLGSKSNSQLSLGHGFDSRCWIRNKNWFRINARTVLDHDGVLALCTGIKSSLCVHSKAQRNWKIFVSALSKRLLVITIITKQLIAVIIVILTIIITIFNRYFRYITKITSIWPVIVSLTANETIITVIFAIKISENNRD